MNKPIRTKMKVLAKLLMMTLVLGVTNPILAKENSLLETLVTLKELDKGKVQLTYIGKAPEKLHVFIFDESNREIFKETIRSKRGVKKPYDISNLPYGEYRFEVRVADEIVIHNVNHVAPEYPGKVKLMVTPLDESKFAMMVMGPENKDFKLQIYDESNKLLFQESIHQTGNFGKIFSLRKTRAKTARVVLINRNGVVQSKTISL